MELSRISGFYQLTMAERLRLLQERGLIGEEDYLALCNGEHTLKAHHADKMIENVIGIFGLPMGLALNFLVNNQDRVIPLAVEEPSIVAALSSAAKVARQAGGFFVEYDKPILLGQIQVVNVPNIPKARAAILEKKHELISMANSFHPNMVARGGGAEEVEVLIHPCAHESGDMMVVHLAVNTCDAMGANLVNTMCEGIAGQIETITGGQVFLRILSNLADRALVKAQVTIPTHYLDFKGHAGEKVRDGIILATEFARIDPYRAATHNKGIMNGVDALAIATGNDWRAIEAAAHAYAARCGRYTSLTQWTKNAAGDLVGVLEMPMKVGIVGAPIKSNPAVAINLRLLAVNTAAELAQIMGAVGLAQNFAALRALVTEGIQRGHMNLHARSVAMSAGARPQIFETVVERLIESGEIKSWKAREIIFALETEETTTVDKLKDQDQDLANGGVGHGKIILLGEHAAVYGRHVIAAPVPLAMRAKVLPRKDGISLLIPRWGVELQLHEKTHDKHSVIHALALILERLGLQRESLQIEIFPSIPRAMGLGSSAALSVAIIRALEQHYHLNLANSEINAIAFECEKLAHGTPSGVDNTVATYGQFLLYQGGESHYQRQLQIKKPLPIVVGVSGVENLTAKMVAQVRARWQKNTSVYERIFDEMDALTLESVTAIENNHLEKLGDLMNVSHGLLNSMQLSTWELEEMIQIARNKGALGAKLTGGGGGGSMIALCPENKQGILSALHNAGYHAMEVNVG